MARWVKENSNPLQNQVGDCVIRAIAKATGKTWDETYVALMLQGFQDKNWPSANAVWGRYLKRIGFKRNVIPDSCQDCYTVEQFCEDHQQGRFVLALQSHVVAVIDGQYFDTWDSGQEIPIYYWERTE